MFRIEFVTPYVGIDPLIIAVDLVPRIGDTVQLSLGDRIQKFRTVDVLHAVNLEQDEMRKRPGTQRHLASGSPTRVWVTVKLEPSTDCVHPPGCTSCNWCGFGEKD